MPGWLGGIGEAYADRNFRIYSAGSIGSWLSYFVQIVTVAWLTWELTRSTQWLAVMALLDIVPNVVLMPLAGALADRYDRYKIMLLTSSLLFLQAAALAALSLMDALTIWRLAALVLLHGVFISFMVPAMYGTVPRFVARPLLASAIAVASTYAQLAIFVGPALAGWIVVSFGTGIAFALNAAGYVALIVAFLCLKTPADYQRPERSSRSVVGDICDGAIYIFAKKALAPLLVILFVADALSSGFFQMLPAYADQMLGMGVVGMSTVLALRGLGATGAALWLAHGGGRQARPDRVLWAFLVSTLTLAAMAQATNLYLAAGIATLMGVANEIRKTSTLTIIQLIIDEGQRGRVMGTMYMFSQLAAGIGAYLIGAFAVGAGLRLPTMVGVLIALIVWLTLYLGRKRFFHDKVGAT